MSMAAQDESCKARRPNLGNGVWAVITSIGTLSAYALATPVNKLVAPGPVVAQQTPNLPVSLA